MLRTTYIGWRTVPWMDKEGNVGVRRTTSNDQNENLKQSHIFSTAKIIRYFRLLTLPLAQRRRGIVLNSLEEIRFSSRAVGPTSSSTGVNRWSLSHIWHTLLPRWSNPLVRSCQSPRTRYTGDGWPNFVLYSSLVGQTAIPAKKSKMTSKGL